MRSFWNGFYKRAERTDILDALSRESEVAEKRIEKQKRNLQGGPVSPSRQLLDDPPDAYYSAVDRGF